MAWFTLLYLAFSFLDNVSASFGTYEVTRRDFPFVDPSRCRQPDFCGLSLEWDLKFGRPITTTAYFPGNATHTFNVTNMNVLIFGSLKANDEFHSILTNISSAGVVVISVQLQNKRDTFDYIQDLLRVAFDMFYENDNIHSHFYQKLSGSTVIVGYDEIADRIMYINHDSYYVHSSIKGIVSLSLSLQRDHDLLLAAQNIRIDNVLFIAGTTDSWRPISNQRPVYTQIPTGKKQHNGVCKTYIEIQGGNHCFFVDYHVNVLSECYRKEMECPSFKVATMSHKYQLDQYSARILYEYLIFASNPINETATEFQQYLIRSRDTAQDIQYLQSCYVDDILFAHDQYFPQDTEQIQYRNVH